MATDLAEGYTRADVADLVSEIRTGLPDAVIENWRDYGFAVDVITRVGTPDQRVYVACQPGRDEIGQPQIFRSVAEIKERLQA